MNTFDNYLDLLIAIFKRAVRDAKRGDRSARLFLQHFGVKQGVFNK